MAKKTSTKAADAATEPTLEDAELNHPSSDGCESNEHKRGDAPPRNKRWTGDSAAQLSAADVADEHGADVIAANEAAARELRKGNS